MNERWLPVVGYESSYEVSDQGHIQSLDRVQTIPGRWGKPIERRLRGQMLKPKPLPSGYLRVSLAGNDVYIHIAVLEAFIGPCPSGEEACHGNGTNSDNRLTNLRWDTHEANERDKERSVIDKRTHCKWNHEFTPENSMPCNGGTARRCRICYEDWKLLRRRAA